MRSRGRVLEGTVDYDAAGSDWRSWLVLAGIVLLTEGRGGAVRHLIEGLEPI
jgi:hypothetical protein